MKLRILVTLALLGLAAARCGDGNVERAAGETCDDGNTLGHDGCSPDCQEEENFVCFEAGKSLCFPLTGLAEKVSLLQTSIDSLLDESVLVYTDKHPEGVVDHALVRAKIDTALAQQEATGEEEDCRPAVHYTKPKGLSVVVDTAAASDAPGVCGNKIIEDGENCDDGNNSDHDGCDASCHVECGFDCSSGRCQTVCGDGIKAGTEHCDSVIGCTDQCIPAPGWDCDPVRNECRHECGNGHIEEGEECDGGHHLIGHFPDPACSEDCKINPGWVCNSDGECTKDCPEGEQNANVAAALAHLKK